MTQSIYFLNVNEKKKHKGFIMNKSKLYGKVLTVIGPVVDVKFDEKPKIPILRICRRAPNMTAKRIQPGN